MDNISQFPGHHGSGFDGGGHDKTVEHRLTKLETDQRHLATKTEIADLRTFIEQKHGQLMNLIATKNGEVMTEIAKGRLTALRWSIGACAAVVVALAAFVGVIVRMGGQ
jgi:hypothetical protein